MKYLALLAITFAAVAADPLPFASGNGRFVGGINQINTGSVPFIAAVYHTGPGFLCGGVIVTMDKVLTTAECVYAYSFEDPIQVTVEIGSSDLSAWQPGQLSIGVAKIVIHPEFHNKEEIFYNNLAVLKLASSIIPSAFISVIALPDATTPITPGVAGNMAGWGGADNSILARDLQIASGSILAMSECKRLTGMVIENEFCLDPAVSSNACKYDHGSPFYIMNPSFGSMLLGIVNYAPCTTASYPTIYTSIPDYVNWIQTT